MGDIIMLSLQDYTKLNSVFCNSFFSLTSVQILTSTERNYKEKWWRCLTPEQERSKLMSESKILNSN